MLSGGLTGCSAKTADDVVVGDCLQRGGPSDRPEASKAACGTPESNFKVVAVVSGSADGADQCPTDIDSFYSMRSSFSDSRTTICLDIDWVVGGCMSIDPENGRDPIRVDCPDTTMPGRQRATQILQDVASADQCASGVGYAYEERNFTVCVEHVA
ncbi:MAG: hypothetical protein KDB44_11890 [Mycobacterium sp.]|nr:hypothetical protein [Mycobacterium sp.]